MTEAAKPSATASPVVAAIIQRLDEARARAHRSYNEAQARLAKAETLSEAALARWSEATSAYDNARAVVKEFDA